MKSRILTCITAVALCAALAIPAGLSGQEQNDKPKRHHYKLIDLGTLGGPQSYLNEENNGNNSATLVNNRGTLTGWADTSAPDPFPAFCFNEDCFVSHAFQWHAGVRADLGALADGVSSQASWISASGLIAGVSENGDIDPLISGFPELRAVLWRNGRITDLGTLPEGGYESVANAVNSRSQVVGSALNTIPDPNSMVGGPTQTRAFRWQSGTMQDLGTLGTGTDAMAQFINEHGQVVGWSYIGSPNTSFCIFPMATHSFIWDEKNKMRDIGTLGGSCTIATGINDDGVAVGDNVNDQTIQRGFLWKDGVIQDLGGTIGGNQSGAEAISETGQIAGSATLAGEVLYHATAWRQVGEISDLGVLEGDLCSFASSINSKAQIVGASQAGTPDNGCTFDNTTSAVLWENGSTFDLNALIPLGASLHLQWAQNINDRGEIAGTGVDPVSGNKHAFLLIPCHANSGMDCQEVIAGESEAMHASPPPLRQRPPVANPGNSIRQMLRRRLGPVPHMLVPKAAPVSAPQGQVNDIPGPTGVTTGNGKADFVHDDVTPSNWLIGGGACDVNFSTKKLSGYCTGPMGLHCVAKYNPTQCPPGAAAKHPQYVQMCVYGRPYVDTARSCNPF